MNLSHVDISPPVAAALASGRPLVALETTIIAHGLPWPENLDCARRLESVVDEAGAVPATIGICGGRLKIGLAAAELERFARSDAIIKVSRRDLATVIAAGGDGATTVAATMWCASRAGIRVFATGGLGGVHRGAESTMDISADLTELARTPVAVVCAGAKSLLDLPKTLEVLETWGVPVIGFATDEFPAFYCRESGLRLVDRVDTVAAAARVMTTHDELGLEGGMVFATPIPAASALPREQVEAWVEQALSEAAQAGIGGKAATPFLLKRIVELSDGAALLANLALVENNVRIAAGIACALADSAP